MSWDGDEGGEFSEAAEASVPAEVDLRADEGYSKDEGYEDCMVSETPDFSAEADTNVEENTDYDDCGIENNEAGSENTNESLDTVHKDDYDDCGRKDIVDIQETSDYKEWVRDINPNYDWNNPESPWNNNCGSCAYAVENRFNGDDEIIASQENIPTKEQMEETTGMEQKPMNYDQIQDYLTEKGSGAHGIVGIDRIDGTGHWFNAYNDNGKIVAVDGQTGEVSDWPPSWDPWEGNIKNCDFSIEKEEK